MALTLTTGSRHETDFIILGTGYEVDLEKVGYLDGLRDDILLWRDVVDLDDTPIDRAIDGRDFVVGDSVTLADILLIPMVEYVKAMPEGKELISAFPNLRRATDKLAQRPSYVAATQPPAA